MSSNARKEPEDWVPTYWVYIRFLNNPNQLYRWPERYFNYKNGDTVQRWKEKVLFGNWRHATFCAIIPSEYKGLRPQHHYYKWVYDTWPNGTRCWLDGLEAKKLKDENRQQYH